MLTSHRAEVVKMIRDRLLRFPDYVSVDVYRETLIQAVELLEADAVIIAGITKKEVAA